MGFANCSDECGIAAVFVATPCILAAHGLPEPVIAQWMTLARLPTLRVVHRTWPCWRQMDLPCTLI
jgi:hypothetical protein